MSHLSKKPSPTVGKKTRDSNKIRLPPKVITVNRDVATMVDEMPQEEERGKTNEREEWDSPLAEIPPHPRPRTYSDSFIRNTSKELLVEQSCEACGHPSTSDFSYPSWTKNFETGTSLDLLCNCNSEEISFIPPIPMTDRESTFSDFQMLKNDEVFKKSFNSYPSLDRKQIKAKCAASFIPRHIVYGNPNNSSFVKKIKRNLPSFMKNNSEVVTKKPSFPLSEIPVNFSQRKSNSLVRHFKVPDGSSRDCNADCGLSSASFDTPGTRSDFVNMELVEKIDYPTDIRSSSGQNANYKYKNKAYKGEMTGVHKNSTPLNVSSINMAVEDKFIDRFSTKIEMPPRRIMSSSELWKDRMISNYSMSTEPIVYTNYESGDIPLGAMESGGYVCGGAGSGIDNRLDTRTFCRDDTECDMIVMETKQDMTGFHHCLCDNNTQSHDNKCATSYFHIQDDKAFPPAPDVTGWTVGVSGVVSGPGGAGVSKGAPPWPLPNSQSSSATGSSSRINTRSRQWSLVLALVLVVGAAGVAGPIALRASAGAPLAERLELANRLLHETPLIDGHNDLPWNIRKFLHNKLKDFKFDEDLRTIPPWSTSSWSHTDLPRLKQGRVSAQFWAAYVPCEAQNRDAVQLTFEQIDLIRRLTDQYQPSLTLCTTAEDIRSAHTAGRVCSLVGVEGGHAIGGSLGVLRSLQRVGVRYLTLTSTCNTPWADCALSDSRVKPEHGGLTPFGKVVVKEMNRLGIIVDLSHVSIKTMKDAIAVSKAPVIFSHSSAHSLCNSTRNVPDAILKRVANNRGLVMINFYSKFLSCSSSATVQDAIAHINHVRDVAGVDCVGLGAGYDGINFTPRGLEDVSSYPLLFAELMANGWSVDDLKKLAGLNLLRVMEAVEKVSSEQKSAGILPYEDSIQPRPPDPYNCSSQDLF